MLFVVATCEIECGVAGGAVVVMAIFFDVDVRLEDDDVVLAEVVEEEGSVDSRPAEDELFFLVLLLLFLLFETWPLQTFTTQASPDFGPEVTLP